MYTVDKKKCIGCGLCANQCSGGMNLEDDGKAEITDSQKLEECGGESVCPYGAIEKKEE